jgi:hypothetical protein
LLVYRLSKVIYKRSQKHLLFRFLVMEEPEVRFSAQGQNSAISDGSWNLRDVMFSKPAELSSFAVIDLVTDPQQCDEAVKGVLNSNCQHGMVMDLHVMNAVDSVNARFHGSRLLPNNIRDLVHVFIVDVIM